MALNIWTVCVFISVHQQQTLRFHFEILFCLNNLLKFFIRELIKKTNLPFHLKTRIMLRYQAYKIRLPYNPLIRPLIFIQSIYFFPPFMYRHDLHYLQRLEETSKKRKKIFLYTGPTLYLISVVGVIKKIAFLIRCTIKILELKILTSHLAYFYLK